MAAISHRRNSQTVREGLGLLRKILLDKFKTSPGMMARVVASNRDSQPHAYRLYTHWETTLRTCQSYKLKDRVFA
jgi:hypothetical protein